MFDLSRMNSSTYELKLRNGKVIHVYSPKLKKMKSIMSLAKDMDNPENLELLTDNLVEMFSSNKEKIRLSKDTFDDFDYITIQELLVDFFGWISGERSQKN